MADWVRGCVGGGREVVGLGCEGMGLGVRHELGVVRIWDWGGVVEAWRWA